MVPHASPVFGVSAHVESPSHARVMQSVDVHVMPVPVHDPGPHVSPHVHGSPSSHAAAARHCQTEPTFVQ